MSTIQQLVNNLGPGWSIIGSGDPIEETVVAQIPSSKPNALPNETETVNRGTGQYYITVKDPEGHQRALFLKAQPIKGGLNVRQSGVNDQTDPQKASIYTGDLKRLEWDQGKPVGDVPQGRETPSTGDQLERLDAAGKVIQPGDTTSVAVMIRDPKLGTTANIPKDATDAGVITAVGNDLYIVKKDGSSVRALGPDGQPLTKPQEKTTTTIQGLGLVEYDPASGSAKVVLAAPPDPSKEVFQVVNGKTYRWDPSSKSFSDAGLPEQKKAASVWTDPNTDTLVWYDDQGNEVARATKPGWEKPAPYTPTALTPDTKAKNIVTIDPKSGQPVFTPNANQVTVSQATSDLAAQLGLQVAAGSMSEDQAQTLITNAINAMNAQHQVDQTAATAAGNVVQGITQGAQTGAGILQNRVANAQQMLGSVLGLAGQGQRSGNMGGGLMNAPAGLGEQLVGGIQGWATELGGGPDVYTSAANLVRRADPQSALGGDAAGAYAALGQMLQKYRDLTGQPHPAEVAAARPPAQTGGLAAPVTAPAGFTPPVTAPVPAALPPSLPAGPTGAPTNQVPGQNYGTGYNTAQLAGPRWPSPVPLPANTQIPYSTVSNPYFTAPVTVPL